MTKKSNNQFNLFIFIIFLVTVIGLVKPTYSQSPVSDSSFHPYVVNYWVSGSICGLGAVANIFGVPQSQGKQEVTLSEMQALNKSGINSIDSWALKQDPSKMAAYENYSSYTLALSVALPGLLRINERFDAIVTGASDKGTWVRLLHPPVEGKVVNGFEGLDVGHKCRVQLLRTDVERGYIDFKKIE